MSEDRLRELERRFQATKTHEDEVAWLQERLRTGVLSQYTLWKASFLGHAPARDLVNCRSYEHWEWTETVLDWPLESAARAALVCAESVLALYEESCPGDMLPRNALLSAAQLLKHKTSQIEACVALVHAARQGDEWSFERPFIAGRAAIEAARFVQEKRNWELSTTKPCGNMSRETARRALFSTAQAMESRGERNEALEQVIAQFFIPWLLGYKDPLDDLIARLEQNASD